VRPDQALAAAVAGACGAAPLAFERLVGGCIAEVWRVTLDDGRRLVAKRSEGGGLEPEAFMLRWLAAHSALPVPAVRHADDRLLLMDYVETSGRLDDAAQAHAAELLAALHDIGAERFGFERDTLIGPLEQPNPWTGSWVAFFRDQRLLDLGRRAFEAGRLPAATLRDLEAFCGRLERYLEEPAAPSLIHGDVWDGNILVRDGRVAAFIDPAIHFAHPEVELAFSTLFGTFGPAFFRRYRELRPLAPGFFETRRDIYNLYPLLVHSRLFGGHYPAQVARILARFG
jgi:fructosamine-3-kinase